jgi:tetratricopeptide (TPR) repeat protein
MAHDAIRSSSWPSVHQQCQALATAGQHVLALDLLREHLLDHPRDAAALALAGDLLLGLGRAQEAIPHLEQALGQGCDDQKVRLGLAQAHLQAGRPARCLELLQACRACGDAPAPPRDATGDQEYQLLMDLADHYAALSETRRARRCYLRAAQLEPAAAGPLVRLGTLALQEQALDQAQQAFEQACRLRGDRCEAYAGLAMVYQHRCQFPLAFDMYLKCLDADQDNLVALLGLFQTSCQMGSFAKVIHYLEVYLDRHPGDTAVLFCLATLYAREGLLLRARRALLDVLALEPDKPEAADLLTAVQQSLMASLPQGAAS